MSRLKLALQPHCARRVSVGVEEEEAGWARWRDFVERAPPRHLPIPGGRRMQSKMTSRQPAEDRDTPRGLGRPWTRASCSFGGAPLRPSTLAQLCCFRI